MSTTVKTHALLERLKRPDFGIHATFHRGDIMTKKVHARELGDPFPSVRLPSVHGKEIDFSSFRGRRLLIFSWSSW